MHIISSVLKKVIDGNYYNIAYAKPYGIQIHGKTGTNAYDDNRIKLFDYPSYADCDVWFAGYSKNFTIASWSGFDEPKKGQNNYFGKNDSRRYIVKDIFKESLSKLELKKNIITKPSSLTEVNIVKGINKNYLPNEYVPTAYIVTASFKNDDIPTEVLPLPTLKEIENIEILSTEESLFINIQHQLNDDELYLPFFGKKSYILTFSGEDFSETHVFQTNTLELNNYKKSFTLTIAETFENNTKLTSNPYIFNYDFSSLYNI